MFFLLFKKVKVKWNNLKWSNIKFSILFENLKRIFLEIDNNSIKVKGGMLKKVMDKIIKIWIIKDVVLKL